EDLHSSLGIPDDILRELSQPTRRSLRQRNPIQLHPYLVEDVKYRGLLKGAGIQPVQIAVVNSNPSQPQNDSQEFTIDSVEPPNSSPADFMFPPSPLPDSNRSPRSDEQNQRPLSLSQNALKDNHLESYVSKRRKMSHIKGSKTHAPKQISVEVVIDNTKRLEDLEMASIDAPTSPPGSRGLSAGGIVHPVGFQFPQGFDPPLSMLTPVPAIQTDLNDEVEVDTPVEVLDEAPIPEAGSTSGDNTQWVVDDQMKRVQRRIKGILPASWLRLDFKQNSDKPTKGFLKKQQEPQASQAGPAKGVARKITRTKSEAIDSSLQKSHHEISVDSSSSGDEFVRQGYAEEAPTDLVGFDDYSFNNIYDEMDYDIPEDNHIDDIFPPVPKSPSKSKKSRSNNLKTYSARRKNQFSRIALQQRIRTEAALPRHPQPKRKAQAPILGVLDAPDVAECPRKEQPHFLRIAARQARSRLDQGRSNPHHKVIKLVSREDTEDTNKVLQAWKSGIIKKSRLPVPKIQKSVVRRPRVGILKIKRHNTKDHQRSSAGVNQPTIPASSRELAESGSNFNRETPALPVVSPVHNRSDNTVSAKTSYPGGKWVFPREFGISSSTRNLSRMAEFESSSQAGNSNIPFGTPLAALKPKYRYPQSRNNFGQGPALNRFLTATPSTKPSPAEDTRQIRLLSRNRNEKRERIPRKRTPTRFEMENIDNGPNIYIISESRSDSAVSSDGFKTSSVLGELENYNTLPVDFNITPLRAGTYFHDSTFLRNDFARTLSIGHRDLNQNAGIAPIHLKNQTFRWGAWNDTVSTELGYVFEVMMQTSIVQDSKSEPLLTMHTELQTFESVIRYVTDKLFFIDSFDRIAFVDRAIYLSSKLRNYVQVALPLKDDVQKRCLKLASLNIVFANQIRQIADHSLVSRSNLENTLNLVKDLSQQILFLVLDKAGIVEILQLYKDSKSTERRDAGVRGNFTSVEGYVLVFQILKSSDMFKQWFQEIILSVTEIMHFPQDVHSLENTWRAIFTILPLNEIDIFGIGRPGSRFHGKHDNWPVVQRLVGNVLSAYDPDSKFPASYINYCCLLFHRCFALMTSWGWRDCKPILDTLFDFFTKHMMYNLKSEETFGSPSFLDHLESNPSLDVQPGDSCFHIFLKILGCGLKYLSGIYDNKKISNISWRFLPNHGRAYPKEKPLRYDDLDALRNHHDLLCTLYWALPDDYRPRLETLRGLVDPATSHLETCNLSINSWRRLCLFKLSTGEDISGLEPFANWYEHFASELVQQHVLARTEAEEQANGQVLFSKELVELTIAQNQGQIESLLCFTLTAMNASIKSAISLKHANSLITGVPFGRFLSLFNPAQPRIDRVIKDTLQLIVTFIDKDPALGTTLVGSVANDDSREYGDWSATEEIYDMQKHNDVVSYLKDVVQPHILQLISNCFGDDRCPEDTLLLKVTECWSCLACVLVRHRLHSWDSYLNRYGKHSWTALRTTPQTQRFMPQFLASCIAKDRSFYTECRMKILVMWMSCLVERTSLLKHQNYLTETVVNANKTSPLFQNLPFARDIKDDCYRVPLSDFTNRRITLISTLLWNMREHLHNLEDSDQELKNAQEEYRELIIALMTSMKEKYQELERLDKSAQGQYVEFVHRIVGLMQQHSQTMCPIDKFFMDPISFPQPVNDPTYIVDRLKGYGFGLRLSPEKWAKQLIMFVQSVSEKTAVDGQQDRLVDQLCTCTAETYEAGSAEKPSLRSFLLQCVFPAYIECSLRKAAWIFAWPILKAISRIFDDLVYEMDANDSSCILSVNGMVEAIFQSIYDSMSLIVDHPGLVEEPYVLVTLQCYVDVITSSLPIIDYMKRTSVVNIRIIALVKMLHKHILFAVTTLIDPSMAVDPNAEDALLEAPSSESLCSAFFVNSLSFAAEEFQTWLNTKWSINEGKIFFRQGDLLKELNIGIVTSSEVGHIECATTALFDTIEIFLARIKLLDLLDGIDSNQI
ncbi:Mus7/MMS22 family-domain-containing protein, partial [Talaromyces proteolyticus]